GRRDRRAAPGLLPTGGRPDPARPRPPQARRRPRRHGAVMVNPHERCGRCLTALRASARIIFPHGSSRGFRMPRPDRKNIVPRLKTTEFTKALREMKIPADQMPYTEPFAADLLVTYAFDLPGLFQMASNEMIDELGVARDELRELAITNLRRQLKEVGIQDL